MRLNSTDKKIQNILQANGRITNAQLAAEVGISPPGMLDRVKRLENHPKICCITKPSKSRNRDTSNRFGLISSSSNSIT